MFYLVRNEDEDLCVVEGDDVNQAEEFLLTQDDRLDTDIVSNFEFCSITVYHKPE